MKSLHLTVFISFLVCQLTYSQDIHIDSSLFGGVAKVCIQAPTDSLLYYKIDNMEKYGETADTITTIDQNDTICTVSLLQIRKSKFDNRHCISDSIFTTLVFAQNQRSFPIKYDTLDNGKFIRRKVTMLSNSKINLVDKSEYSLCDNEDRFAIYGVPRFERIDERHFSTHSDFYRRMEERLTELGYSGFTVNNYFDENEKLLLNEVIKERGHKPDYLTREFLDDIGFDYQNDCLCTE